MKYEFWYGSEKISDYPDIIYLTYDYFASHKEPKLNRAKLGKDWYIHDNIMYVSIYKEIIEAVKDSPWLSYTRVSKTFINSDDLIEVNHCV